MPDGRPLIRNRTAGSRIARALAVGLLALVLAVPGPGTAQQQESPEPLLKSELVRLIVGDTYSDEEVREIVRRSCLTFRPTSDDLLDFQRLGAGEALLDVIEGCREETAPESSSEIPVPPAPDSIGTVDSPLGRTEPVLNTPLEDPLVDLGLADPEFRPPAPSYETDEEGFVMLQETAPRLRNPGEVRQALQEAEPSGEAAADGVVRVMLEVRVQEDGSVDEVRIVETSGREPYDDAAREVALQMEFDPATNRGRPMAVWARQVLVFR